MYEKHAKSLNDLDFGKKERTGQKEVREQNIGNEVVIAFPLLP
jgi:hypothetical protein